MAMPTNRPSHVSDVDITPTHMSDGAVVITRGCGNTMRNWHLLFFVYRVDRGVELKRRDRSVEKVSRGKR
jgi:hypothetical protein